MILEYELDDLRRELAKYYSWRFAGAPRDGGSQVKDKINELEKRLVEILKERAHGRL